MAPVVQIKDIHKIYDSGEVPVHAVRGVSLDIHRGEMVALMGASGSGKSTLMNVLGCLDRPTRGTYLLDGINIAELDRNELADLRNQKLGFVFQGFNLLARTTALENVELPMLYGRHRKHSAREIRERAMHCLEIVGLANRYDHFPNQLSGGQQQRVAIARCLVQQARVILADEPIASLDPESARNVMEILARINREQGVTVLVSLHQVAYARRYCRRVVALRGGEIVHDGRADELSPAILRELYGSAVEELLESPGESVAAPAS